MPQSRLSVGPVQQSFAECHVVQDTYKCILQQSSAKLTHVFFNPFVHHSFHVYISNSILKKRIGKKFQFYIYSVILGKHYFLPPGNHHMLMHCYQGYQHCNSKTIYCSRTSVRTLAGSSSFHMPVKALSTTTQTVHCWKSEQQRWISVIPGFQEPGEAPSPGLM